MKEKELGQRFLKIGFWYEATMNVLKENGLVELEFAAEHRQKFYEVLGTEKEMFSAKNLAFEKTIRSCFRALGKCGQYASLTDIARLYSNEQPGYVIQNWMRCKNTIDFLRIWELINNDFFRDDACAKLIKSLSNNEITITPTMWIKTTGATGLRVKRGKGGGVVAHGDIAFDFRMWLDPNYRYHLIWFMRENQDRNW